MISVVIPTLNDADVLTGALRPLTPAAIDGFVTDVIIADGGSADATLEIADDAGCRLVREGPALTLRLNAALAVAKQPWLLFLSPSAWLNTGWEQAARDHVDRAGQDAAYFPSETETIVSRLALAVVGTSVQSAGGALLVHRDSPDFSLEHRIRPRRLGASFRCPRVRP